MSVMVMADPHTPAGPARDVQPELVFTAPPPGMAALRRFTLDPLDEIGFLFALRSVEDPDVRLFVVPPHPYFPDYRPTFDDAVARDLGLEGEAPVVLVVVRPGEEGLPPTANLLAPVVVNPTTGSACQVVLDDDRWPLRAPFGQADAA